MPGGPAVGGAFQNYLDSTGYNFQLGQGVNAVNQSAAARGLLHSGATLKALTNYGQNMGKSYFSQYLNQLSGQQDTGLRAGAALAGVGEGYAGAVGANNNAYASDVGNAALSGANSTNNLIGGALNSFALSRGLSSYGGGGGSGGGTNNADLMQMVQGGGI
jgi:hypothetical protein